MCVYFVLKIVVPGKPFERISRLLERNVVSVADILTSLTGSLYLAVFA
jgi:hypothetical protein